MTGVPLKSVDRAEIQLVVALVSEQSEPMEKQRRKTSVVTRQLFMSLDSGGTLSCDSSLSSDMEKLIGLLPTV